MNSNITAQPVTPDFDQCYPLHIFDSTFSRRPSKSMRMPAGELLRFLSQHRATASKDSAGLFSGVEYLDPSAGCRKLTGIRSVHMVVGDIDSGFTQASFDAGCETLRREDMLAVAYQTYSSAPDAQRWRVVVLLDEPIDPADYRQCWDGLNAIFGGTLDQGAKDAARLSYLPSHPIGETRLSIVMQAQP